MSSEETVIHCLGCGKELWRGPQEEEVNALVSMALQPEASSIQPYCANCTADDLAEAEWEAQLEERFLKDQWDLYIRSQEELSRKADMG